jgi:hypothetical protein
LSCPTHGVPPGNSLIAKKYHSSGKRRKAGRPPTKGELRDLVIRMAEENRGWGYTRIRGATANLGHELGRGTIAEILRQAGLKPAPERENTATRAEFLRAHRVVSGATDFFTGELWKWAGLVRYHVLFVIRLSSRTVQIAGIVPAAVDWGRRWPGRAGAIFRKAGRVGLVDPTGS